MDYTWLLAAYVLGTGFGWYLGLQSNTAKITELLLDRLIDGGYLRYRKVDGETIILKLNGEEE